MGNEWRLPVITNYVFLDAYWWYSAVTDCWSPIIFNSDWLYYWFLIVFILPSITFSLTFGHRWQEGLSSFPSTRDPLVIIKSEKTQSNPFWCTFKVTGTIPLPEALGRPSVLQFIVVFLFKLNLKKINKISNKSELLIVTNFNFVNHKTILLESQNIKKIKIEQMKFPESSSVI